MFVTIICILLLPVRRRYFRYELFGRAFVFGKQWTETTSRARVHTRRKLYFRQWTITAPQIIANINIRRKLKKTTMVIIGSTTAVSFSQAWFFKNACLDMCDIVLCESEVNAKGNGSTLLKFYVRIDVHKAFLTLTNSITVLFLSSSSHYLHAKVLFIISILCWSMRFFFFEWRPFLLITHRLLTMKYYNF